MSDMSGTIRVAGREGLLSAIPVLLGFHPADSVVIACLGKNNRVAPVIRVDLAAYLSGPVVLADQLGRSMTQFADRGVLVFYGIEADPHDLVGMLVDRGVCILVTVFVDNDPQVLHPAIHAEYVGQGRVVAGSREALRFWVEFDEMSNTTPDPDIIACMHDRVSRDVFLATHIGDARATLARVLSTCRRVADPEGAAPTAVLANLCAAAAFLAYRTGDGALAQICCDRALRVEDRHGLAQVLLQAMSVGITPEQLDSLVEGIAPAVGSK
jgi:hypothetical protein